MGRLLTLPLSLDPLFLLVPQQLHGEWGEWGREWATSWGGVGSCWMVDGGPFSPSLPLCTGTPRRRWAPWNTHHAQPWR